MFIIVKLRKILIIVALFIALLGSIAMIWTMGANVEMQYVSDEVKKDYITWVDFDISSTAMQAAMDIDIETYNDTQVEHLNWIELLAYLGTQYGGDFSKYKAADLNDLVSQLNEGNTIAQMTEGNTYYEYFLEAYSAALGGFLGEFEVQVDGENGELVWEKQYGLKAFSPIASGFYYTDYDDFGSSRSYGYNRRHLGHDMMALTGTPVVAVESGIVEIMGWNQYGGWRIGIRSFDGSRYYYYAHLRQNRPYAEGLEQRQIVMAGDVIGYVGRTGYSATENVNGIDESHLHYGIELVFDESQKESENEIWIDAYQITRLLYQNRSLTQRNDETKEHTRVYGFREEVPENHFEPQETEDASAIHLS